MVICCLLMPQSLDSDLSDVESIASNRSPRRSPRRSPQKKSPSKKGKGRGKNKQADDSLESMVGSIIEHNKELDKKVWNLSFHVICTPFLKPNFYNFMPFYSPDGQGGRPGRRKDLFCPPLCCQSAQDSRRELETVWIWEHTAGQPLPNATTSGSV